VKNLVYLEDLRGRLYFFEYSAPERGIRPQGGAGTWSSFNAVRAELRRRLEDQGTDLRVPDCVITAGGRENTYSCFRCSGCHRPVQVVRNVQPGLRRAKHSAADYDCLYYSCLPLNVDGFHDVGNECWGTEPCPVTA
jgi:hypothetical protein